MRIKHNMLRLSLTHTCNGHMVNLIYIIPPFDNTEVTENTCLYMYKRNNRWHFFFTKLCVNTSNYHETLLESD